MELSQVLQDHFHSIILNICKHSVILLEEYFLKFTIAQTALLLDTKVF